MSLSLDKVDLLRLVVYCVITGCSKPDQADYNFTATSVFPDRCRVVPVHCSAVMLVTK